MSQKQNDFFPEAILKKLLYKSRNRGCKETDLLLGSFAIQNLYDMSLQELQDFSQILEQNDADIYEWLTGKAAVPASLRSDVMEKLLEFHGI